MTFRILAAVAIALLAAAVAVLLDAFFRGNLTITLSDGVRVPSRQCGVALVLAVTSGGVFCLWLTGPVDQ